MMLSEKKDSNSVKNKTGKLNDCQNFFNGLKFYLSIRGEIN